MGILLGLLTALTWGGADFLARFATRRIGTLRAMFYMQGIGFVLLTIFLPWLGGWGHLTDGSGWRPWAWGLLAGGINADSVMIVRNLSNDAEDPGPGHPAYRRPGPSSAELRQPSPRW